MAEGRYLLQESSLDKEGNLLDNVSFEAKIIVNALEKDLYLILYDRMHSRFKKNWKRKNKKVQEGNIGEWLYNLMMT